MKFLAALLFAGKFGKVFVTGGTMLLSVFAYALLYGWRYAVGVVGLIFVHEMGHLLAARSRGLAVGAPVFVPFVGAWISLKSTVMDSETEAFVGLAGPMLGSVAALLCYLFARESGDRLWMAIAYVGFFINLFNLIPLSPLDGGRVVTAISAKLWFVGLPCLVAVFAWRPGPLLLIIAVLALPQFWATLTKQRLQPPSTMTRAQQFGFGLQYLGLLVTLALMAFDAHDRLEGLV